MKGTASIESSIESRDEEKQERAWKGSLRIVGFKEGDTVLESWIYVGVWGAVHGDIGNGIYATLNWRGFSSPH